MKSNSLLVLACLVSTPVFAQGLPDEINHAPYEAKFRNLSAEVSRAQAELSQSQSDLEEARKFIREMSAHIASLNQSIDEARAQIADHQRRIPELDQEIGKSRDQQSHIGRRIRELQTEESKLHNQHQHEYRNLRPLEEQVARREQSIRELTRDLAQHQRLEAEASARFQAAQRELAQLDQAIDAEKAQQRQFAEDLRNIEVRIVGLQNGITKLENENNTLRSQITAETPKLDAITRRVEEYQKELQEMTANNAPAEEIKKQQLKLAGATRARDTLTAEIRGYATQINNNEKTINQNRAGIAQLERDRGTMPQRLAASEARERQLLSQRPARIQNFERFQREFESARRNVITIDQTLRAAERDIRPDVQNLERQRQVVVRLAQELENLRANINELSSRHRALDEKVAQLNKTIQQLRNQIPVLEREISTSQAEISQGRTDIQTAEQDITRLSTQIASQETKLSKLTSERDTAQSQMSSRLALYNKYYTEAQELGSSQSESAVKLGDELGLKLSNELGKKNGQGMGRELGNAEAKHWGYVRGEVIGFENGYAEGFASKEEISRAEVEGKNHGKRDAHLYVQSHHKPAYYEEMLLEEFKRPLGPGLNSSLFAPSRSLKHIMLNESRELVSNSVPELSRAEIEASKKIITSLDDLIAQFAKDIKALESKADRLGSASASYTEPAKIPYGAVNCGQVYKNLAVFKTACDASYKADFQAKYLKSAETAFYQTYTSIYSAELLVTQEAQRNLSFEAEFKAASKVGHSHGLKLGKEEIFKKTYSLAHQSSYQEELPAAHELGKADARRELNNNLATRPLLTMTETSLKAEEFRGSEEVNVLVKVKNISSVALNTAAIIRITQVEHAEIIKREAVLNTMQANSVADMPSLTVRVLPTSKAGDKLVVKGVIELPGDQYKAQRVESFKLEQVLSANPAHSLEKIFDASPSIKGIFRRNIHFLTAKIAPSLEDMPQGYKVSLTAVGENAGLINLNEKTLESGALKKGQVKEVKFSYTFPDGAKNKKIVLEIGVTFNNKVIRKEQIELFPH